MNIVARIEALAKVDAQSGVAAGETPAVSVFQFKSLEREEYLLLYSVCRRNKRTDGYEEVWILTAAAKCALDEDQTLESDVLGQPVFEPEMVCSNIHSTACSQIVVS